VRKQLIYIADPGQALTLKELGQFVDDTERLGIWQHRKPVIETVPLRASSTIKGLPRKITVEDR
jgi:hypothetical protein